MTCCNYLKLQFLCLCVSTITTEICLPALEKGEPGPPGKPGRCGCELQFEERIREQLTELTETVKILNAIATPPRMDENEPTVEEEETTCIVPSSVENGIVYSASNVASAGGNIVIKCRRSFYMDVETEKNELLMTCQENGDWNKRLPYCYAKTCRVPSISNFVSVSTDLTNLNVSANITYRCYDGYEIHGADGSTEKNVICRSNGKWTENPPHCVRSYCGVGFRDGRVRDEQISASSFYNTDWLPHFARLDKHTLVSATGGIWLPGRNYRGESILVDFVVPTSITGVVTQGYPEKPWWVTGYTISYGNTPDILHTIQRNGKPKVTTWYFVIEIDLLQWFSNSLCKDPDICENRRLQARFSIYNETICNMWSFSG